MTRTATLLIGLLPLGLAALCLAACGGDGRAAPRATGRYVLDREDYARRLAAEQLDRASQASKVIPRATRQSIQKASLAEARALTLSLELRGDGAFLARYGTGKQGQRLAGSWTQTGDIVAFETTQAPSGRVTTIPAVRARRTDAGLVFDGDTSGWAVPHPFVLRRVE